MGRGGFSFKRALGISKAKSRISRSVGVPFTRSGRQRKIGKAMGGCCIPIAASLLIIVLLIIIS